MISHNTGSTVIEDSAAKRPMKRNRPSMHLALILCLSTLPQLSLATDGIVCGGTVSTIGVHGTDRVMLRLSGMNTIVQICNLTQTIGANYPISAEQCKAAYAMLVTAYAMGSSMSVFFDNVQTGTTCSNFANWEVATARWVHLDQ